MEIERQFLVESLPSLPTEYETLRQGYVALEPEIRIRQLGSAGRSRRIKDFLTVLWQRLMGWKWCGSCWNRHRKWEYNIET